MDGNNGLTALLPGPPDWAIPWEALRSSPLGTFFARMEKTPQNPAYHGEGDVWTHTRMTCEALAGLDRFRRLEERQRQAVFLAALLHDAGKIVCTRMENGNWVSPRHAAAGAELAREALWLDWGLCGRTGQALRETVCALIRRHSLPPHAALEPEGERRLLRAAANGELLPDFTVELLCLLAEADILGRRCADREALLEAVALCRVLAEELDCLTAPRQFPDGYTAFACLSGQAGAGTYPLYDDTWGEVILLSGLPGTGKDTWIAAHCPELPAVSLDGIREELGIGPTQPQGPVIAAARARAQALLRQKRPFVWNATNLSPAIRQKQVELFTAYHASVRIVYLETEWEERRRRNRSRAAAVPEEAVLRMLSKLTPPERFEAHQVEWRCV